MLPEEHQLATDRLPKHQETKAKRLELSVVTETIKKPSQYADGQMAHRILSSFLHIVFWIAVWIYMYVRYHRIAISRLNSTLLRFLIQAHYWTGKSYTTCAEWPRLYYNSVVQGTWHSGSSLNPRNGLSRKSTPFRR